MLATKCDSWQIMLFPTSAGTVSYRNVTYEYEPGSIVLKDVDFTVPGGQTIALVVGCVCVCVCVCETFVTF